MTWCPVHAEPWAIGVANAALIRTRLTAFRLKWRDYAQSGYTDLIRVQSGRQALLSQVRNDLRAAMRPFVAWRCRCEPLRIGSGQASEPWDNTFVFKGTRTQRALAWLEMEFGREA